MKLSFKITLFSSIISIVFMLFIFTNTQKQLMDSSKQYIISQYENDLKQLKNSFDLILKKSTDILLFSTFIRKDAYEKNPKVLKQRFDISMKNVPQVNKMKFISLQGKEVVVSSRERLFEKINKNISYTNKDIFKKALENKIYYSDIYFTKPANEMMIDISQKMQDLSTQETLGVLIIQVSLGSIQEVISDKLANKNGIALLNLGNKQFLYKSSKTDEINADMLISSNKSVSQIIENKKEYLVVSSEYRFDRLKMKLFILNDNENIFSNINTAFKQNLLVLLFTIFVFAIIMFLFITYIFKPLKTLVKEIQKISNEISGEKKEITFRNLDEVNSIKENFDLFVKLLLKEREKLKLYNKNLEAKVQEELRKNQEQEQVLANQSKMASMGEMIGNIAHQWRQPLSIITTSASGLDVKSDYQEISKEDIKQFTKIIVDQAEYLSKTIDDFRNFIKGDIKYLNINIKDVIENTIGLVKATLDNNYITLITDIQDDMCIYGNKNELTQALINIINNTKDSMKDIETENKLLFISTKKLDKDTIEVKILDNGGGIPENIIHRIFEPYFTTKHKSIGTGIGLSMVDQIIRKRHNGVISVSNEEYRYNGKSCKGASFRIKFSKEQKKGD